jgi:thioredoxin-related protein
MKKLFSLLIAASVGITAFAQQSMPIGTPVPTEGYETTNVLNNKVTNLKDAITSKGLLVVFTCNTCPFVIRNIDRTKEILAFAKEKGIGVLMVNSNEAQRNDADAPKQMLAFAKAQQYPNYVVDKNSSLADIFGASHTPEVYLFDGASQKLVYKGAMDDNPSDPSSAKAIYLKDAINNLLAGNDINPNETKSVGCSIKRLK